MGGTRAKVFAVVALAMSPGCPFDSSGSGSGAASVGDTGGDTGTPGTSSVSTSAGDADESVGSEDADAAGCPAGGNGCPCDGEACDEGLACANGTCVPADCGNGNVEANEECDDQNDVPDDGCEPNCAFSTGAAQIAAGKDHTCAVTFDGRVRCWGVGAQGRTGQYGEEDLGDDEPASQGIDVPFTSKVKFVALGDGFGCALIENDHVACWGRNANGRLGLGSEEPAVLDAPDEEMMEVALGVAVEWLAVGTSHACVVLDGGAVRCWGQGAKGRLGRGDGVDDIGNDESPGDGPTVKVGGVASTIAAGREHTCVLLKNGDVRCWGEFDGGRLGIGETGEDIGDNEAPDTTPPLDFDEQKVKALYVGGDNSCAIVGDSDELWCWGEGGNGRLGTGATDPLWTPTRIATGGRTMVVDIGWEHTCVLLDHVDWEDATLDRVVRCFGVGMDGQLGAGGVDDLGDDDGERIPELTPVDVVGGEDRRVMQLAAGEAHTCVTTSGGAVRCWGLAAGGRLGYGNEDSIGDTEAPADAGDVDFE